MKDALTMRQAAERARVRVSKVRAAILAEELVARPAGKRGRGTIYMVETEDLDRWRATFPASRAPHRPAIVLTCAIAGCENEVVRWPSDLAKNSGGRAYCPEHRCFDDPQWRASLSRARTSRFTAERERLLAEAGRCGSPTCSDPQCEVRPGGCHAPGCLELATIASQNSRGLRWIKGYPTLCCREERCASLVWRESAMERSRRDFDAYKKQEGLIDLREAANRLAARGIRRASSTLAWEVRRLGIGRQFRGFGGHEGAWALTEHDFGILERHLSKSAYCSWHNDPELRPAWYKAKFGSTAEYGRFNRERAAAKGTSVGRRPELSNDERARIDELLEQGWTQQRIANRLGISRDQVKRQKHARKKLGETPS